MDHRALFERHRVLITTVGFSLGIGFVIALVGHALVPSIARLPGFLLCGNGDFELVLRRRTSYGLCPDGAHIHYALVTLVSALVWALVFSPAGLLLARWHARRLRA